MTACMSSARPMTPSTTRDLWAPITSSMPGRRIVASRTPDTGCDAPAGPKIASSAASVTTPFRPKRACPGAAPDQRRLTPRHVVTLRRARMIVPPGDHRLPVIGDRLPPHHPHPRQPAAPPPDRTVAIVFSLGSAVLHTLTLKGKSQIDGRVMAVNGGPAGTELPKASSRKLSGTAGLFVAFGSANTLHRWVNDHHGHPRSPVVTQPHPASRPHRHHRRRPTPRRPGPPRPPPRPRAPHPLHQVGPPPPLRPHRHRHLDRPRQTAGSRVAALARLPRTLRSRGAAVPASNPGSATSSARSVPELCRAAQGGTGDDHGRRAGPSGEQALAERGGDGLVQLGEQVAVAVEGDVDR